MRWEQDGGQLYQECLPNPPGGWIQLNVGHSGAEEIIWCNN